MRAKYFFEVAEVPSEERVKIAALHLDRKALQWHRGYVSLRGDEAYADWAGYLRALAARFGSKAFADPLSDLRNLKQVTTLQEYMDAFDELYPRTGIREDQAMSFFLSGLVDELQMPVRMFKPTTLADAYALAKLQEMTVAAIQKRPKPNFTSSSYAPHKPLSLTTSAIKPVTTTPNREVSKSVAQPTTDTSNRITNKEMDERRAKGLCFWCEEKYTPGHKCPRKRVYVMQLIGEEGEGEVEEEQEQAQGEGAAELQLSLHAMWGIEGGQVMRIRGEAKKKSYRSWWIQEVPITS